jgi:tripartite-type tricarboxylate transporter receptor subunit TctC
VPFPAGGPTDVMGRMAAQQLSSSLGQNVIVENVPGAGGTAGSQAVARASPDGYTLLQE